MRTCPHAHLRHVLHADIITVHADPVCGRRRHDNWRSGNVAVFLETKEPEGEEAKLLACQLSPLCAVQLPPQIKLRWSELPPTSQGSALFWAGFALVVWGWAIIGFCVETYGFFLLFSGFFPTVLSFLRRVPFLDKVLDAPGIKRVRRSPPTLGALEVSTHYFMRASEALLRHCSIMGPL